MSDELRDEIDELRTLLQYEKESRRSVAERVGQLQERVEELEGDDAR